MYNSCNGTRVHRKYVWNPQCNILNLMSPSGEMGLVQCATSLALSMRCFHDQSP